MLGSDEGLRTAPRKILGIAAVDINTLSYNITTVI